MIFNKRDDAEVGVAGETYLALSRQDRGEN